MLTTIAFLLQKQADGLQRFHDFVEKNKCFSVQLSAHSNHINAPGKGVYIVSKPTSFRLKMDWAGGEYTYIKNAKGSVDFEREGKFYQEYSAAPGLVLNESAMSPVQSDSMPFALMSGNLQSLAPAPFKMTSQQNGIETYTATWENPESKGKATATIGTDGRILQFDFTNEGARESIHRVMDFSNYVFNPPIKPDTFAIVPPVGYVTYHFNLPEPTIQIGEALKFGKWKSASGVVDIDPQVKGKLVIIRTQNSKPADALLNYFTTAKLSVSSVVLSLSNAGGAYWSPEPSVAAKLSTVGTPLMLLMTPDGKVKRMWMGFDKDNPNNLAATIAKAVTAKGDE